MDNANRGLEQNLASSIEQRCCTGILVGPGDRNSFYAVMEDDDDENDRLLCQMTPALAVTKALVLPQACHAAAILDQERVLCTDKSYLFEIEEAALGLRQITPDYTPTGGRIVLEWPDEVSGTPSIARELSRQKMPDGALELDDCGPDEDLEVYRGGEGLQAFLPGSLKWLSLYQASDYSSVLPHKKVAFWDSERNAIVVVDATNQTELDSAAFWSKASVYLKFEVATHTLVAAGDTLVTYTAQDTLSNMRVLSEDHPGCVLDAFNGHLLTDRFSQELIVWDLATGQILGGLKLDPDEDTHYSYAKLIAGRQIVYSKLDGQVRVAAF